MRRDRVGVGAKLEKLASGDDKAPFYVMGLRVVLVVWQAGKVLQRSQ